MNEKKPRKPAIAEINKTNAKQNIVRKKNVLDSWARNGIPYVPLDDSKKAVDCGTLEFFPRTIRQFNFWDGSANSLSVRSSFPTLARNSNDTLRSYPALKSDVERVLDALLAREVLQQNRAKPIKVKKLIDSNTLEKKLRVILENELVNVRKQQAEERRKYNDEVASLTGQVTEMKLKIRDLESGNLHLAQQVRHLKGQLIKVVPLKGI